MSKLLEFIKHPLSKIQSRSNSRFIKKHAHLDDETFLKMYFKRIFHYKLDLNNPITYNEKLQWLKLYDRKPLYTKLVDKVAVRDYVKQTIGEEYLIPIFGVWDKPEDIDFSSLPDRFVLKCNHNSGLGMFICKDKTTMNEQLVVSNLKIGLKEDFYLRGREWPYKDVPRKIICEEFLDDGSDTELVDYKLLCFNGVFKVLLVCSDRHTKLCNDWYDSNLCHLPCINGPKNRKKPIQLSNKIKEMIVIAEKLTKGIPQARVDLYDVNGKIYFGEITLFESSGFAPFKPKEFDTIFGNLVALPKRTEKND